MPSIFPDLEGTIDDDVELRLAAYLAGFGDLCAVPIVIGQASHAMSPRGAFVLSLVDGRLSVGEILQATPMRQRDTLTLLCEFASRGLIAERDVRDALPEGAWGPRRR